MKNIIKTAVILAWAAVPLAAADLQEIKLNKPQLTKGDNIMKAFSNRKSVREFSAKQLDLQTLSNLLWAANGVNRDDGKRTAPSAMNRQEIDVYVCRDDGAYFYNAHEHKLVPVSKSNCRQFNVLTLILVANAKEGEQYAAIDAGIVSQNISLFAAGMGLATVPRMSMPQQEFRKILNLKEGQQMLLNHPVGYPAQITNKK
ncbi:nitroreductase [Elusimicrobium simillimum]|uniref:SagB/ThcOx family dehydrogenase n=1 Tax=Elusimicrobium simillimum TaxID=3143438 RepID=UPI003C6F415E